MTLLCQFHFPNWNNVSFEIQWFVNGQGSTPYRLCENSDVQCDQRNIPLSSDENTSPRFKAGDSVKYPHLLLVHLFIVAAFIVVYFLIVVVIGAVAVYSPMLVFSIHISCVLMSLNLAPIVPFVGLTVCPSVFLSVCSCGTQFSSLSLK